MTSEQTTHVFGLSESIVDPLQKYEISNEFHIQQKKVCVELGFLSCVFPLFINFSAQPS